MLMYVQYAERCAEHTSYADRRVVRGPRLKISVAQNTLFSIYIVLSSRAQLPACHQIQIRHVQRHTQSTTLLNYVPEMLVLYAIHIYVVGAFMRNCA